jgi:hypothetical protein
VGRGRWLIAPLSLRDLSGFAPWGFVLLSVLATGLGFADLCAAGTDTGKRSILALAITSALTLFVVSAVFVFYLVFAIWSVGFGFFWKELSGQVFMRRRFVAVTCDMASAVGRATAAAAAWTATLEAAQTACMCASCPASTPGEGSLMRGRFAFAGRTESLRPELRRGWIDPIAADRNQLEKLARLASSFE